jgi:hypothetical protein
LTVWFKQQLTGCDVQFGDEPMNDDDAMKTLLAAYLTAFTLSANAAAAWMMVPPPPVRNVPPVQPPPATYQNNITERKDITGEIRLNNGMVCKRDTSGKMTCR